MPVHVLKLSLATASAILHASMRYPPPAFIICQQMGVDMADVWSIKKWTDAWTTGLSPDLSEKEKVHGTDMADTLSNPFSGGCGTRPATRSFPTWPTSRYRAWAAG